MPAVAAARDASGQLICVRIIDRHELHTGIHQGRYECQVTGQAVEFGDDELGFGASCRLLGPLASSAVRSSRACRLSTSVEVVQSAHALRISRVGAP